MTTIDEGRTRTRSARRKARKALANWDPATRALELEARKKYRRKCVVCTGIFYLDTIKPEHRQHFRVLLKSGRRLWWCPGCSGRKPKRIIYLVLAMEAVRDGKPIPEGFIEKVLSA